MKVALLVGTVKGGFLFRSDAKRSRWSVEGPLFRGWKVTAAGRDLEEGYLLATASDVYGVAVQRSRDLREWRQVERGPRYKEESGFKMNQIWTFGQADDRLFAGVDEAGLFESADGGESWSLVEGLSGHPTRKAWFPGFGGLCAHSILSDPKDPKRLWCGISAVGVFRSEDGGRSWTPKNRGVTQIIEDKAEKEIGFCVHGLVQDPTDASTIWRQDHRGMYRTRDGGDRWEKIEEGLPSGFGFPIALDAKTKSLYCIPLESDEYRMPIGGMLRVYRSRDGGDSWHPLAKGLPQENAYMGVLRSAMCVDGLDPGGVYLGTTSGAVFASADGGDSWTQLPASLPRILAVQAFVER
jgi:photosystem II stability/assembly factor-like uncharacterized protein